MTVADRVQNEGYEIGCSRCSHKSLWHMRTPIEALRDARAEGWSQSASGEWLCPKHTQMLREGFRT
jgi:DNA-directed RNA polymerase subunit RPC12/RpoP